MLTTGLQIFNVNQRVIGMMTEIIPANHIVVFNDQQVRRVMHDE